MAGMSRRPDSNGNPEAAPGGMNHECERFQRHERLGIAGTR